MENLDKYEEINVNKKIKIEDKIYYLQSLQNFTIKLENFIGFLNIYLIRTKKCHRFFYKSDVKEDFFIFKELQSVLLYFEGVQDISNFMIISERYQSPYIQQDDLFLKDGYKQFMISHDLIHLKNKLKEAYGLDYYQNDKSNLLYFGLYNFIDLELLQVFDQNNDIKIGILWGGSDIMLKTKLRDRFLNIIIKKNYENYAMSEYIWDQLEKLGVKNKKKVCVSFCWTDYNYLKKMDNKLENIFVYDGIGNNSKKDEIYNKKIVDQFINKIPSSLYLSNCQIFRTSSGEFIKNIIDYYSTSFVSLRLTNYDGNANSAQECGMLGIPVISNQNMNHCISWSSLEEIVKKVEYIRKNNIRIYWQKDGINLLFISNDEIGKGGGATFTFQFMKYLEKKGFNIWIIFLVHKENNNFDININSNDRIIHIYFNTKQKWNILDYFDKIDDPNFKDFIKKNYTIILRSYIPMKNLHELQKINSKIIFFIPGIFKNNLNQDWKTIGDSKIIEYLNISNMKIANNVKSFCNSKLTKTIYQKYANLDLGVLEINLLQLQNNQKKWENSEKDKSRNIDYLLVVSNVNRKIKNVELFYQLRSRLPGKFCLISSDKIENKLAVDIEYVEGLNYDELEKYYQRTKILISPSFFDSMSNTVIEAIDSGCFVLISNNQGVYVSADHIIPDYKIETWEKRCLEVIHMWKENINKILEIRQKTRNMLLEKSWEVEIKVLDILSKN